MVTCSVKTSPKPSTIFFFFLRYCMQKFISIQHLPSCLSYSDFQQFGYDDPGYVHFFFVLSYLCFNLLGSIIWHSYLWLLSLKCLFWTVYSLRHNTSKSKHVIISQSTLIFLHYPKPTSTFAHCI